LCQVVLAKVVIVGTGVVMQRLDVSSFKLGPVAAKRLAAMSDLPAERLQGLTVAEISEKFRFEIDPQLLLFVRYAVRWSRPIR
jgi:hypothetical protein